MEMAISLFASVMVFLCAVLRLNGMHYRRGKTSRWEIVEAAGLVSVMAGASAVAGEWFLPGTAVHGDTILVTGAAIFAIGVSRGRFEALCRRLHITEWDGVDRRSGPRR